MKKLPIIIYDDRANVGHVLSQYVGKRAFGSIQVKNESLVEKFRKALPEWASGRVVRLSPNTHYATAFDAIPNIRDANGLVYVSAYGAINDGALLKEVLERVPYSKNSLIDDHNEPLVGYVSSIDTIIQQWRMLLDQGLAGLIEEQEPELLVNFRALSDIRTLAELLKFVSGATASRAFNETSFDQFTYRKQSSDIRKIRAEHDFYALLPESMKSWMVGAYNFKNAGDSASYEMRRYMIPDASFQWIHDAWKPDIFDQFLDQIFHFLSLRETKTVSASAADETTEKLFRKKVQDRREQLLAHSTGQTILRGVENSLGGNVALKTFDDYFALLDRHWKDLRTSHVVIGHGDPCLSNILYDPPTHSLKLIDPKGAISEEELWTHPLYDYCKLSHSILGNYDFINNQLFRVVLDHDTKLKLEYTRPLSTQKQLQFSKRAYGVVDANLLRLGEASLFLSMLPLHLDYPNKVVAFLLRAREVVDEIM